MKKKTIILLLAFLMISVSLASAALAERVNSYDYTVDNLIYQSRHSSINYSLAALSSTEGETTAMPMDANKVSPSDIYHAYMFDEDNQFQPLESQLRWLVNNSLINGNKSAEQVKNDINALAVSLHGFDGIRGTLSDEDAVAGAQAALMYLAAPSKSASFISDHSSMNFYKVSYYYHYMLECRGASLLSPAPSAPTMSIDIQADTSNDVTTVMISDKIYKVLPYVYTQSNNSDVAFSLTTAPTDSYVDDVTTTSFNIYVPVSSLADASGTTITVLGTITSVISYTDICTFAAANKGGSIFLGQSQFSATYTAEDTDTSPWTFPAVFSYELTLHGKQSGDAVEGVEFTFTDNAGFTHTVLTDSSGKIFVDFLPCGDYYLNINKTSAENAGLDSAPDDYGLFTTTTGLSLGASTPGTYKKTLEISEMPASICLYKYCNKSELPLPFAVFGLFVDGSRTPIAQAVSDADGRVLFENLYPGDSTEYTIKETTSPVGYIGDYYKQIELSRGETYDSSVSRECCIIFNKPEKVSITAFVKDSINLEPIQNATIEIYEGDYSIAPLPSSAVPVTYGTTDSQGKIILSGLFFTPASQYTILQSTTIAGYSIDTNKYLLDLASIQLSTEVTFFNAPDKGIINVEILTTRSASYYDDLEFLLIGAPQYPSTEQNKVGTIASLETSYTSLYPGTYKLHQVVPPVGYTEDTTVDLGITVVLAPGETKTITLHDTELYDEGNISLLKTDDSENALEGAQFNLYLGSIAELDAMSATEFDMALLTTEVTDSTGLIEFGQFRPGTYTVVEVAAPAGYAMPTEDRLEFNFEDGNVVIGPVVNVYDPNITATPVPTNTPAPTATLPPNTPATGEGSILYIAAALFALLGIGLFVFRKRLVQLVSKKQ